jgi:hypothetical protein
MNSPSHILTFILTLLAIYPLNAQIQIGTDINGETIGNNSGNSVSMPDSNTIAIGAYWSDGNGFQSGQVKIYSFNGTSWIQKGININGEAVGDQSGSSISMPDSNTVAIGANLNDGNGANAGHVRVYYWDGIAWVQKGMDIDGEAQGDEFGAEVSMPDANTIAIGAYKSDGNYIDAGHVRIFSWNGSTWAQKGLNISGEAAYDYSCRVSMPDANTVAVGAYGFDNQSGHVRVYNWNGTSWFQKGMDINGESANDYSGCVSMPDVNTLAIGAWGNDGNGTNAGHTRIFSWNGSTWVQKGLDIDGEATGDQSGLSICMPDSNTVAIGANMNDGNGADAGHARIFCWNGSTWIQKGIDINGESTLDEAGYSVSMPDKHTIAVGAPENENHTGHVRVYSILDNAGNMGNSFDYGVVVFPNPTKKIITIDLGSSYTNGQVNVKNAIGQEILNKTYTSNEKLELTIEGEVGLYFVEIISGYKTVNLKVIKE